MSSENEESTLIEHNGSEYEESDSEGSNSEESFSIEACHTNDEFGFLNLDEQASDEYTKEEEINFILYFCTHLSTLTLSRSAYQKNQTKIEIMNTLLDKQEVIEQLKRNEIVDSEGNNPLHLLLIHNINEYNQNIFLKIINISVDVLCNNYNAYYVRPIDIFELCNREVSKDLLNMLISHTKIEKHKFQYPICPVILDSDNSDFQLKSKKLALYNLSFYNQEYRYRTFDLNSDSKPQDAKELLLDILSVNSLQVEKWFCQQLQESSNLTIQKSEFIFDIINDKRMRNLLSRENIRKALIVYFYKIKPSLDMYYITKALISNRLFDAFEIKERLIELNVEINTLNQMMSSLYKPSVQIDLLINCRKSKPLNQYFYHQVLHDDKLSDTVFSGNNQYSIVRDLEGFLFSHHQPIFENGLSIKSRIDEAVDNEFKRDDFKNKYERLKKISWLTNLVEISLFHSKYTSNIVLKQLIVEIISQYRKCNDVSFFSGWCGGYSNRGHSIVIELKRLENNEKHLIIHNSGSGRSNSIKYDSIKRPYSNITVYQFSAKELESDDAILNLFQRLLINMVQNPPDKEMSTLFEKQLELVIKVNSGTNISKQSYSYPSLGQRGGSCVYKGVLSWLQSHSPNLNALSIRYYIKKRVILSLYRQEYSAIAQNYTENKYFKDACNNYIRVLEKCVKANILEFDEVKQYVTEIENIKNTVNFINTQNVFPNKLLVNTSDLKIDFGSNREAPFKYFAESRRSELNTLFDITSYSSIQSTDFSLLSLFNLIDNLWKERCYQNIINIMAEVVCSEAFNRYIKNTSKVSFDELYSSFYYICNIINCYQISINKIDSLGLSERRMIVFIFSSIPRTLFERIPNDTPHIDILYEIFLNLHACLIFASHNNETQLLLMNTNHKLYNIYKYCVETNKNYSSKKNNIFSSYEAKSNKIDFLQLLDLDEKKVLIDLYAEYLQNSNQNKLLTEKELKVETVIHFITKSNLFDKSVIEKSPLFFRYVGLLQYIAIIERFKWFHNEYVFPQISSCPYDLCKYFNFRSLNDAEHIPFSCMALNVNNLIENTTVSSLDVYKDRLLLTDCLTGNIDQNRLIESLFEADDISEIDDKKAIGIIFYPMVCVDDTSVYVILNSIVRNYNQVNKNGFMSGIAILLFQNDKLRKTINNNPILDKSIQQIFLNCIRKSTIGSVVNVGGISSFVVAHRYITEHLSYFNNNPAEDVITFHKNVLLILDQCIAKLNQKENKNAEDLCILHELLTLKILFLKNPIFSNDSFVLISNEIAVCVFQIHNKTHATSIADPSISAERNEFIYEFMSNLYKEYGDINDKINQTNANIRLSNILISLHPEIAECELSQSLAWTKVKDFVYQTTVQSSSYSINLQSFTVDCEKNEKCLIPNNLKRSNIYRKFIDINTYISTKINDSLFYEVQDKFGDVCLVGIMDIVRGNKKYFSEFVLRKVFSIRKRNITLEAFELDSKVDGVIDKIRGLWGSVNSSELTKGYLNDSRILANHLEYTNLLSYNALPATFYEIDKQNFSNINNRKESYLYSLSENRLIYFLDDNTKYIYELDSFANKTGFHLLNLCFGIPVEFAIFSRFEALHFMEILENESRTISKIKLPRYKISFTGKRKAPEESYVFYFDNDNNYILDQNLSTVIIKDFIHFLKLDMALENASYQSVVFIPNQLFLATEYNSNGKYSRFDINEEAFARTSECKRIDVDHQYESIFSNVFINHVKNTYSGTQHYTCFDLDLNNNISSSNPVSILFLSYIYAGLKQYELAISLVQSLKGIHLNLSCNIVENLALLLDDSPSAELGSNEIGDTALYKACGTSPPLSTALKIQTLCLLATLVVDHGLTNFHNLYIYFSKTLDLNSSSKGKVYVSASKKISQHIINKLRYNSSNPLYLQYTSILNNIPFDYRLTANEIQYLLINDFIKSPSIDSPLHDFSKVKNPVQHERYVLANSFLNANCSTEIDETLQRFFTNRKESAVTDYANFVDSKKGDKSDSVFTTAHELPLKNDWYENYKNIKSPEKVLTAIPVIRNNIIADEISSQVSSFAINFKELNKLHSSYEQLLADGFYRNHENTRTHNNEYGFDENFRRLIEDEFKLNYNNSIKIKETELKICSSLNGYGLLCLDQELESEIIPNNNLYLIELRDALVEILNKSPVLSNNEEYFKYYTDFYSVVNNDELFKLFLLNDLDATMTRLFLDKSQTENLLKTFSLFVQQHIKVNILVDILDAIRLCRLNIEKNELKINLFKLIFSRHQYSFSESVEKVIPRLVFEYQMKTLLRKNQIEICNSLLEKDVSGKYINKIIQCKPGEGKTKYVLPLLTMKATGDNLSVIMVPPSLFDTNISDLKSTVSLALRKTIIPFKFKRSTVCNIKSLEIMIDTILFAMKSKSTLLMTEESIQSLHLKYRELLDILSESLVDFKSKVNMNTLKSDDVNPQDFNYKEVADILSLLEIIIKLFKFHADVICDEGDKVLSITKQRIYSVDKPENITSDLVRSSYEFFKFFEYVQINDKFTLLDVVYGITELPSNFSNLSRYIARQLLDNKNSPIYYFIEKLSTKEDVESLYLYLIQEGCLTVPDVLTTAPQNIKDKMALYKEQLTCALYPCLKSKHNVNYGVDLQSKVLYERVISIPFVGNGVPKYNSEFGNIIRVINFTILNTLKPLFKLDKMIMERAIRAFHTKYVLLCNETVHLDTLPQRFDALNLDFESALDCMPGSVSIADIELDNPVYMNAIYNQYSNCYKFKMHCLLNYILPMISTYSKVVDCNSLETVEMVKSFQVVSGTIFNHKTMHSSLYFNPDLIKGAYGRILNKFVYNVIDINQLLDQQGWMGFLENNASRNNISAILDVGALFEGVCNIDVAIQLSRFWYGIEDNPYSHILFWDKKNILCALKIQSESDNHEIVQLQNTDFAYICKTLKVSLGSFFTYYDQIHTTGMDIMQPKSSIGLLTYGRDTNLTDVIQTSMRFRQLGEDQKLFILLLPELRNSLRLEGFFNLDLVNKLEYLIERSNSNEIDLLLEEHFIAATLKLKQCFKKILYDIILNAETIELKAQYMKAFNIFFFKKDNLSIFEKYGPVNFITDIKSFLVTEKASLLSIFIRVLQQVNLYDTLKSHDLHHLESELDVIITNYSKVSKPFVYTSNQSDKNAEITVEHHNENDARKDVNNLNHAVLSNENLANFSEQCAHTMDSEALMKITPELICNVNIEEIFNEYFNAIKINLVADDISCKKQDGWTFSNNLYISQNQLLTFDNQALAFTRYSVNKKAHFILWVQNIETNSADPEFTQTFTVNSLSAILITIEEADILSKRLQNDELHGRTIWIETTTGIEFWRKRPELEYLHPDYIFLQEQIWFYEEDLSLIFSHPFNMNWILADNLSNKIKWVKQKNEITSLPILQYDNFLINPEPYIHKVESFKQWLNNLEISNTYTYFVAKFLRDLSLLPLQTLNDNDLKSVLSKIIQSIDKVDGNHTLKIFLSKHMDLRSSNLQKISVFLKGFDLYLTVDQLNIISKMCSELDLNAQHNVKININQPLIFSNHNILKRLLSFSEGETLEAETSNDNGDKSEIKPTKRHRS